MRFLLEIAFKGTAYHGWQIQKNAVSVQSILDEKISLLCAEKISTTGCGRTDTGVHAKQFFLHFDAIKIPDQFIYHLNKILPWDISAYSIKSVHENFHARFDAQKRTYQYFISKRKDPFLKEYSYYRYEKLDIDSMNNAAKILLGEQDFECFSKNRTQVDHFRCTIIHAEWKEKDQLLIFTITANRFLRNMVRAIVGTLLEIGKGEKTQEDLKEIIKSKKRSDAGFSVPAEGLFLTGIEYKNIEQ